MVWPTLAVVFLLALRSPVAVKTMTTDRFGVRRKNGVTTPYSTQEHAERIARLWGGRLVVYTDAGWVEVKDDG